MARELRLEANARLNRTTRLPRDGWQIERGRNAARQVLEHEALEAVVIRRMGRAARKSGGVAVVVMVCGGRLVRVGVGNLVRRGVFFRGETHTDPR